MLSGGADFPRDRRGMAAVPGSCSGSWSGDCIASLTHARIIRLPHTTGRDLMRSTVACASFGALVWPGLAGCERAETPTTAETAPAEESMAPADAPASQGASFSVTM